MPDTLKAPFPYFGGKAKIAPLVWAALGDVKHYIEPFFGSGAVLLARPGYDPTRHIETVCDMDCLLANAWRAMQFDPDGVAKYCDWPANHADLNARRKWLLARQPELRAIMGGDPEAYDTKAASYWIWAASCWIGSGLTKSGARPHVIDAGKGVHKLSLAADTLGKRPHVGSAGMGVHKLSLAAQPDGELDVRDPYTPALYAWFRRLSERLRRVRVVCGDWSRVCGGNWQAHMAPCGMFFDPPYSHDVGRDKVLYAEESADVAKAVALWAVERGGDPAYRIVIAGYADEHEWLLERGWTMKRWKAQGGYGNQANGRGKANRHREALFLSPHCAGGKRPGLFGE